MPDAAVKTFRILAAHLIQEAELFCRTVRDARSEAQRLRTSRSIKTVLAVSGYATSHQKAAAARPMVATAPSRAAAVFVRVQTPVIIGASPAP